METKKKKKWFKPTVKTLDVQETDGGKYYCSSEDPGYCGEHGHFS